jgi:hypothetical protein
MPRVDVHVSVESLERLDSLAREAGLSRSAMVRALIDHGSPAPVPADLNEALQLLSGKARDGSVMATVALVRALLDRERRVSPTQRRRDELAARRARVR